MWEPQPLATLRTSTGMLSKQFRIKGVLLMWDQLEVFWRYDDIPEVRGFNKTFHKLCGLNPHLSAVWYCSGYIFKNVGFSNFIFSVQNSLRECTYVLCAYPSHFMRPPRFKPRNATGQTHDSLLASSTIWIVLMKIMQQLLLKMLGRGAQSSWRHMCPGLKQGTVHFVNRQGKTPPPHERRANKLIFNDATPFNYWEPVICPSHWKAIWRVLLFSDLL
jgi:hypothetical protein